MPQKDLGLMGIGSIGGFMASDSAIAIIAMIAFASAGGSLCSIDLSVGRRLQNALGAFLVGGVTFGGVVLSGYPSASVLSIIVSIVISYNPLYIDKIFSLITKKEDK